MRKMLACGLLVLLLAACDVPPPGADIKKLDAELYRALRTGDDATIKRLGGPGLTSAEAIAALPQVRATMARGEPKSSKIVGWNVTKRTDGQTSASVATEYDYGDRVTLSRTLLMKGSAKEAWKGQGLHVQTATKAELAVNGFSLAGRGLGQYLFLIAALVSPLLMIAALVKVIRRPGLKRKWLWGIAAFFGLTQFQMNWANGAVQHQLLSIQLIGAGISKGFSQFDPVVVQMTLPIGALLILTGVWANPARAKRPPVAPAEVF